MRNAQLKKVKYTVVVGDQELANNTVTYRIYGNQAQVTVPLADFIARLHEEIASKALEPAPLE